MDQRPVGLLDSGLGGISVLGEALRQLPNEDYVYYGDTANAPYGDKTPEEVLGLVHQAVERLIELRCKAIVIACNTATSVSAGKLRQELALPIIGMEPALKPASQLPGGGKILVMATRVTLALPKFQALMAQYGRDAVPVPCPGLMECVERGELEGPQVTALLRQLLGPWLSQPVKAVVLGGCIFLTLSVPPRCCRMRSRPSSTPIPEESIKVKSPRSRHRCRTPGSSKISSSWRRIWGAVQ